MSDFQPPGSDGAPSGPVPGQQSSEPATPPGWHPDPWQPGAMRWWSGTEWTDLTSAGVDTSDPAPGQGLTDVGEWFGTLFRTIIGRAGHIFTLLMVTLLPANLIVAVVGWMAIRDITVTDANVSATDCPTGFSDFECALEVDITGWEGRWILPLALAFSFSVLMYAFFNLAVAHQVHQALDEPPASWSSSLSAAARALPRYLGYGLLLAAALLIVAIVLILVAALGGVALAFIAVVAALAVVFLLWIKLSFFTVAAAVAPMGTSPLRASMAVSNQRFGAVALRLFLLLLSGMALALGSNVFSVPLSAIVGTGLNDDLVADLSDDDDSPSEFTIGDLVENPAAVGVGIVFAVLVQAAGTGLQSSGTAVIYRETGGPSRYGRAEAEPLLA